jgi:hypothetical protein
MAAISMLSKKNMLEHINKQNNDVIYKQSQMRMQHIILEHNSE